VPAHNCVLQAHARFTELGIELGTVGFQTSFGATVLGRTFPSSFSSALPHICIVALFATSLALAPESVTTSHLSGRITHKSGSELDSVGKLFSRFLSGQNQTLSVQGESVAPSGKATVGWLSKAFKTLTLEVILPGHVYKVCFVFCREYSITNLFLVDHRLDYNIRS
jgi:hypothetical protein